MVVGSETVYAVDVAMTRGIPFVLSVPYPVSGFFQPLLPKDYPTPLSGLPQHMTRAQRVANRLFRLLFMTLTLPLHKGMLKKSAAVLKVRKQLGIADLVEAASRRRPSAAFAYSAFGVEYPFPAPEKLRMLGVMVPARHRSRPVRGGPARPVNGRGPERVRAHRHTTVRPRPFRPRGSVGREPCHSASLVPPTQTNTRSCMPSWISLSAVGSKCS